jgi:(2Fe-2S) ferredoxin
MATMAGRSLRRVVVCQGFFCAARGAGRLLVDLRARLAEAAGVQVEVEYCFNGCSHGPNVVFHPDRVWYEGVRSEETALIAAHAQTGQPGPRPYGGRVPAVVKDNAHEHLDGKYGAASAAQPDRDGTPAGGE